MLRVQRTGRAHHLWLLLLLLLQDLIGSNQVVHVMQTYTEEFADWVDWCCGLLYSHLHPAGISHLSFLNVETR